MKILPAQIPRCKVLITGTREVKTAHSPLAKLGIRPYAPRENLGGNFCGHDPLRPRLTLTKPPKTGKGGIPFVLSHLMALLKSYYDNPRQIIPSLDLANGSNVANAGKPAYSC